MTPRVRRRTSRCWWRRQPEAGETIAAKTTSCSVAREETSGKAREETPGTAREETPGTTREAGETAAARTTLCSVAREETSGKAREDTPGTTREAGEAADVRITSCSGVREETPGTAREEMTPDEPTESALVTQRQLARERPRPSSPPLPWIPSDTTRERFPSESRTFHREVGSS